jgi:O-antigen ligase
MQEFPLTNVSGKELRRYTSFVAFVLVGSVLGLIAGLVLIPTAEVSARSFFPFSVYFAYVIIVGASLFLPEWSILSLFLVLPQLYIATTVYTVYLGGYPFTPVSLAIWLVMAAAWVRSYRSLDAIRIPGKARRQALIFLCLLATCTPALLQAWNDHPDFPLLLSLCVTGILEPFMLFLMAAISIEQHGNRVSMVWAAVGSVVIGVLLGVSQTSALNIGSYSVGAEALKLRQYSFSFGNANLYGMVLVLVFPLSLALGIVARRGLSSVAGWAGTIAISVASVLTLSRGTLVVLAIEVLFLIVYYVRRIRIVRVVVAALIVIGLLVNVFPEALSVFQARMGDSDLMQIATFSTSAEPVSQSDLGRQQIWLRAWQYLSANPAGGAGALEDVEELFLQTGVHFGWLPAGLLALLLGYGIGDSLSSEKGRGGRGTGYAGAIACSLIGFSIYGLSVGSALSHITSGSLGYLPQNAGAIFLALVLATAATLGHQSADVRSAN